MRHRAKTISELLRELKERMRERPGVVQGIWLIERLRAVEKHSKKRKEKQEELKEICSNVYIKNETKQCRLFVTKALINS